MSEENSYLAFTSKEPSITKEFSLDEAQLESRLLSTFKWKDFRDLDLPAYTFPKMLRGLPRFYHKANPSKASVKKPFSTFLQLKKLYIDKAKLHLYQDVTLKEPSKIALIAKIFPGMYQESFLLEDLADFLQKNLSSFSIQTFVAFPDSMRNFFEKSPWKKATFKEGKPFSFLKSQKTQLKKMDAIIQYPNYFSEAKPLFEQIQKEGFKGSYELLGGMGSIETPPFLEKGRSLGLHFLEKGIFVHQTNEPLPKDFIAKLIQKLSGSKKPHIDSHINYFDGENAPVLTGAFSYVLQKKALDKTPLDFFLPQKKLSAKVIGRCIKLAKTHGVKELRMYYAGGEDYYPCAQEGKLARIFCFENMSSKDRSFLMQLTKDFFVVRDEWGFSKAVLSNIPYFYDVSEKSKHFVKDLVSLGEYYLQSYPEAISYLRSFLQNRGDIVEKTLYVDEDFFQAEQIDKAPFDLKQLQGKTIRALAKLNQVILQYFSANGLILGLVKRAVLHRKFPNLLVCEKKLEEEFLYGKIPFSSFIQQMRAILSPHKGGE